MNIIFTLSVFAPEPSEGGKIDGEMLSDWAVWSVVEQLRSRLVLSNSGLTICDVPVPSYAAKREAIWSRLSSCSATRRFRLRNGI